MRKMKDCGIEWIREIPENWNQISLLNALREAITDGPHETPNYVVDGIPFISVDSLGKGEKIDFNCVKKSISEEDYSKYSLKTKLEDGDILFSKSATIGKTGIVDTSVKFMIWSPLALLKSKKDIIENKYLYYILNTEKYIEHVLLSGTFNTQANVGMRTLEKSRIPLPIDLSEQKKIVSYLDEKVAFIDYIIEKSKKSIEEYKKLKHSIITKAVTKGLNPDVKMKDSGIEWIGNIPEHWEMVKIKVLLHEVNIRNTDKDAVLLSLFTALGVAPRSEMEDKGNKAMTVIDYKRVEIGDLVVNKLLAWMGAIAFSSYKGVTSPDYDVYRFHKNANAIEEFYEWYFRFTNFKDDCYKFGRGIMMMRWRTYPSEFKIIQVVNPPIVEQKEIVAFLKRKVQDIDMLIKKKELLVFEIESYKKSLIYEVVTGKKEIPTQEVGTLGL